MSKGLKKLAPVIGTVGGGLLGGPAGAAIGGALGGMLGGGPDIPRTQVAANVGDTTKESNIAQEQFKPGLQAAQANQAAVSPFQQKALTQMGMAATGQGPSLAEMQLRSAQDRGFAQQLAAAQSQRAASPALAQRQLLLNMGNANRDLAQQSAIQRLQERDAFLTQANQQQGNLGTAVNQQFSLATAPKKGLQDWENQRVAAANQDAQNRAAASNAQQGALMSGLGAMAGNIGATGTGLGGSISNFFSGGGSVPGQSYTRNDEAAAYRRAEGGIVSAPTHKYKVGGPVKGPGTSTSDSIPTYLSDDEFVIKAEVVSKPGMKELLEKINAGKIKADKLDKLVGSPGFGKVLQSKKKDK